MADCAQCGKGGASQTDGICGTCRLRAFGRARRRYVWTEALRTELRAAYRLGKLERARRLDELARRTGFGRGAFTAEAMRLGITQWKRVVWAKEEDALLEELVGELTFKTIAKKLGRSISSVAARADYLDLSRRAAWGYTLSMAAKLLGVGHRTVERWADKGHLGKVHQTNSGIRITEQNLARFLRMYPHEYDLRKVDQVWFKSMMFGRLAS